MDLYSSGMPGYHFMEKRKKQEQVLSELYSKESVLCSEELTHMNIYKCVAV